MKKLLTCLLFLLMLFTKAQAQTSPDWQMPIILSVPGYGTDTTWIGMDANGAAGYQTGLDSLTNTYITPLGIFGLDSTISTSNCFNLKRDIKNFIPGGIQTFDVYIRLDTSINPNTINPPSVLFDTSLFRYNQGGNKITWMYVLSMGGYINGIDVSDWFLCDFDTTQGLNLIEADSLSLIFEPSIFNFYCGTNDNIMMLRVVVGINNYYNDIMPLFYNSQRVKIIPTLNHGDFELYNSNYSFTKSEIKIFNEMGNEVSFTIVNNHVHINSLVAGLYFLLFTNRNSYQTEKFIID